MRGVRHRGLPPELVGRRPGLSEPPPLELPSKRWRDLILRAWHVDPLRCPVCQNPMRVIVVIDEPRLVQKIRPLSGAEELCRYSGRLYSFRLDSFLFNEFKAKEL